MSEPYESPVRNLLYQLGIYLVEGARFERTILI